MNRNSAYTGRYLSHRPEKYIESLKCLLLKRTSQNERKHVFFFFFFFQIENSKFGISLYLSLRWESRSLVICPVIVVKKKKQWLSEHLCQVQTSPEVINKLSGRVMPFFTIILEGQGKIAGEVRVKSFLSTDLTTPHKISKLKKRNSP